MPRVLVAHASKYGSTTEVAERIADVLRGTGAAVECVSARDVKSLDGYSAAVLGTALYFFRARGDGRRFLVRHRKALETMPFAVFGLGPIEDTPEQFSGAREHLDKAIVKAGLTPSAVAVFGGVLAPEKLRFPDSNPGIKAMGPLDLRDWDQINAWAQSLVGVLGLAV